MIKETTLNKMPQTKRLFIKGKLRMIITQRPMCIINNELHQDLVTDGTILDLESGQVLSKRAIEIIVCRLRRDLGLTQERREPVHKIRHLWNKGFTRDQIMDTLDLTEGQYRRLREKYYVQPR